MKFTIIDEKSFRKFADKHPYKTYMQTPEIAKIREKSGWQKEYVAVEDNNKILAAALLLKKKKYFSKYEFYSPRGLLIDYKNFKLLKFFIENLKKYISDNNGYMLRIDPYVLYKQRDIDGNIVKDGIDNSIIVNNLNKLGFIKNKKQEQISWMFCLDFNKDENELLKSMRSFTRRNINKGLKNSIYIREAEYEELELVKNILDDTSERKGFANRNLKYFQNMYKEFKPREEINFIIAEIHVDEYINNIKKNIKEEKEKLSNLKKIKSSEDKISKQKNLLEKLNDKLNDGKKLKEENGNIIPLSTGVFITYGDEIVYLFGGNIKKYMYLCAPYVVQWEMIRRGLNNKKYKRYNFYGIPANINKHPKDYGVYDFKKGFTGYVEELIGEFTLPINKTYYIINFLKKIKDLI